MTDFPAGITVDEASSYINVELGGTVSLLEEVWLPAAVDFIRGETKRQFELLRGAGGGNNPITIRRRGNGTRFVRIPDASDLQELNLDDVAVDLEDPEKVELHTRRYPGYIVKAETFGDPPKVVEYTGLFGFTRVPDGLRNVIYRLAARGYNQKISSQSDAIPTTPEGGILHYFNSLPADIKGEIAAAQVASDRLGLELNV